MSWNESEGNKIAEQISKIEAANGDLAVKIATNKIRLRNLIGKSAGVAAGGVVVSKGQRYEVVEILSDAVPKKGKPVLSGLKIAKNGNVGKRPVEIKGAWSVEGAAAPKKNLPAFPRRAKPARKASGPTKRRPGRPSKKSLENYTVLGTA